MNKLSVFLTILLAFSVAGCKEDRAASKTNTGEAPPMMMTSDTSKNETGNLINFTNLEAVSTLAKKGPTVLFFSASWCPTCQSALREIRANIADLKEITVVVVDYDKATDLKNKYRITYQDTYVQIDSKGEKLAIWNGGGMEGILRRTIRAGAK